jgi:GDP-D-glucose phosphorylase
VKRIKQNITNFPFLSFLAPLEKELVCEIRRSKTENVCDITDSRDVIIINVSPIDIGHCLLVPSLEENLPQILTESSIRLALQVAASSGRSNFKMAFNSLCAYASVNHLHWHMYYLQVIHSFS